MLSERGPSMGMRLVTALRLLRRENPRWKYNLVRSGPSPHNIVEQDHWAIKRRYASMLGFKSFANAAITIAGIELTHRIRKRQFSFGPSGARLPQAALGKGARRSLKLRIRTIGLSGSPLSECTRTDLSAPAGIS